MLKRADSSEGESRAVEGGPHCYRVSERDGDRGERQRANKLGVCEGYARNYYVPRWLHVPEDVKKNYYEYFNKVDSCRGLRTKRMIVLHHLSRVPGSRSPCEGQTREIFHCR